MRATRNVFDLRKIICVQLRRHKAVYTNNLCDATNYEIIKQVLGADNHARIVMLLCLYTYMVITIATTSVIVIISS